MGDVSIYDVARAAGVHSSTVSRAFTRPSAVKTATRDHILEVAAGLGYRVNPVGQALRRGASTLVPLIVPDITNPFYGELANEVGTAARDRGYQVVLCVTQMKPEQTEDILRAMDALLAPFAIVAPSIRVEKNHLGQSALARRMVVLDRVPNDVNLPTVTLDNRRGVKIALQHLLDQGHTRIAYLTGMVGTYSGHDRLESWRELAPLAGVDPVVIRGGYDADAGRRASVEYLGLSPRPTAVIASNDMAALSFLSQAAQLGVRVPDDLSIVGFDGVGIGATSNPPLTTVLQPIREMSIRAVELAEQLAASGEVEHVQVQPGFLERSSTRDLRI